MERLRLRADGVDWQRVDGEIVALDFVQSRYLAVNATGTALWASLAKGATREELAGLLIGAHGISQTQAHEDVDAFVAWLQAEGLLEPAGTEERDSSVKPAPSGSPSSHA